jgi:hypothetical protein
MRLGALGSRGGFGSLGSGGGSDRFSQYLLYDDFTGSVAALDGRLPRKGPAWSTVGSGAAFMMAGDGELNMDGGSALVGYATAAFDSNAGKLTAVWSTTETAPILYPATLAFLTGFNTAVDTVVHGEQVYIRLLSPANASFIMPQWYLIASAVYATGTVYRTEFFVEGKHARMATYNHGTGALVAYEYVYDADMQARMGPLAFFEIIDNKLRYNLVTAEAVPADGFGGWPTLDIRKETKFPANADGFVGGPYGGSVSWVSANNLSINTTGAYGTGGSLPIGSVVNGDRIWFSFDVVSGGSSCLVTVVPTSPGGPVGGIYTVTPDATGRYTFAVDISASEADASFLIAGDGAGTSINIANLLIIKNPPTSM